MSFSTTDPQSRAFIESQQYSKFILTNLHDGDLPDMFYRNVSDFAEGEVLDIKTVGSVVLQDVEEDTPIEYNPMETSSIQMRITDYKGDAWYITDKMRQDGSQIEQLLAMRAVESTRAFQEDFETKLLETANEGLTEGDANLIAGFPHRFIATGTNNTLLIKDLVRMKLAFDKAKVPAGGRVLIVDPIVAATLGAQINLVNNVDANDTFMKAFNEGWSRDHQFVMEIHGFHIITSNRLPEIASETIGSDTITNAVPCIAMCIADDNCTPIMFAERQAIYVETIRDMDNARDKFCSRRRYGFGVQRKDTLGAILVSATDFE
jgi:hypothetical protein